MEGGSLILFFLCLGGELEIDVNIREDRSVSVSVSLEPTRILVDWAPAASDPLAAPSQNMRQRDPGNTADHRPGEIAVGLSS